VGGKELLLCLASVCFAVETLCVVLMLGLCAAAVVSAATL
jgi:CHASE1-domain containing sensor protein